MGKIGLFFGGKLGKALLVIAALAALAWAVSASVSAVKNWQQLEYASGKAAGQKEVRLEWEKSNNSALLARIEQIKQDVQRSNQSVETYLNSAANEKVRLVETKERTTVYASSPVGNSQCLDADGVQLIKQARDNLGFPSRTPPRNPAPVPRVMPVAGGTLNQPGRNDVEGTDSFQSTNE